MTSIVGVILCGGASSRMGRDKAALATESGLTFLQLAIERLRPLCQTIILAGRALPDDLQPTTNASQPCQLIGLPDLLPHQGPLVGLLTAMRALDAETTPNASQQTLLLVTPVDMPRLTSVACETLLHTAITANSQTRNQPTIATFDNQQLEPLLAVYPLSLLPTFEALHASGQHSLHRWLQTTPHRSCLLPTSAAGNINTPQDYLSLTIHPEKTNERDAS